MNTKMHDPAMPVGNKPAPLPEELGMYVDALRKQHGAIQQVWVLAAPETGCDREPWELLVFADGGVLEAIRADRRAHRDDVDLRIVVDGDRIESAWGEPRPGSLARLNWRLDGPQSATYDDRAASSEAGRSSAVRVR